MRSFVRVVFPSGTGRMLVESTHTLHMKMARFPRIGPNHPQGPRVPTKNSGVGVNSSRGQGFTPAFLGGKLPVALPERESLFLEVTDLGVPILLNCIPKKDDE